MRAYAELAQQGPVVQVTLPMGLPVWLVTRYGSVRKVLNDPALLKAPSSLALRMGQANVLFNGLASLPVRLGKPA